MILYISYRFFFLVSLIERRGSPPGLKKRRKYLALFFFFENTSLILKTLYCNVADKCILNAFFVIDIRQIFQKRPANKIKVKWKKSYFRAQKLFQVIYDHILEDPQNMHYHLKIWTTYLCSLLIVNGSFAVIFNTSSRTCLLYFKGGGNGLSSKRLVICLTTQGLLYHLIIISSEPALKK